VRKIELLTVSKGYDRKTCWVHARPAVVPGDPAFGIITTQKLLLSADDCFFEINDFRSEDGGKTWTGPNQQPETLGRKLRENGLQEALADFSPMWHAATGVVLATGLNGFYRGDEQSRYPDGRRTKYSVFDPKTRTWAEARSLEFPDGKAPFIEGAGCTQRVDLPDGNILLPTYFRREAVGDAPVFVSTVMRCRFDGETLSYLEHGSELTLPHGRGFVEPSLACWQGRYFLTLRNDAAGYVTDSADGLHFATPKPWIFDDGSELGSYNTQQKWVTFQDELHLVYTRKGANNDHVMRHRAPLFIAQVDPDRLCVLRDTEEVLVPERGARLGNFGVAQVSENESWVTVSEWMQTKLPDWSDSTICEKYGSDNSLFLAKIRLLGC